MIDIKTMIWPIRDLVFAQGIQFHIWKYMQYVIAIWYYFFSLF